MTQELKNYGEELVSFGDKVKVLYPQLELRLSKLTAASGKLKELAGSGMSPEVDEKMKNFIQAAKTAKADFNSQRMPLTRKLNEVIKSFTELENSIEAEITDIQKIRDSFATVRAKEEEEKKRIAQYAQNKEKEVIELEAQITLSLDNYVADLILAKNMDILSIVKESTPENALSQIKEVRGSASELTVNAFKGLKVVLKSLFENDIEVIKKRVFNKKLAGLKETYRDRINEYIEEAVILISSIERGNTNVEESVRAAQEQAKIEKATSVEIAKAETEIEVEAKKADLAFETITTEADTKSYQKINVLRDAGYQVIVAYWFAVCYPDFKGNILMKAIGSMITDLEKHATKTGEFLKSDFISYEKLHKAK